jgi:Uma2 family endonuclease
MITSSRREIDFSAFPSGDGKPMAETEANATQMTDLIFALRHLLEAIPGIHVAGNQLMYYNPHDGWEHVSPDVYVATDVGPGMRESWKTWVEGKFPDVVFEIVSPSTAGRDLGEKLVLYSRLGAREYYIFDPQDTIRPRFQAYHRSGEWLVPVEPAEDGRVGSAVAPFALRVHDGWLRAIDAATGDLCATPEEERLARLAAEARAMQAEARVVEAEAALQAALAELAMRRDEAGG